MFIDTPCPPRGAASVVSQKSANLSTGGGESALHCGSFTYLKSPWTPAVVMHAQGRGDFGGEGRPSHPARAKEAVSTVARRVEHPASSFSGVAWASTNLRLAAARDRLWRPHFRRSWFRPHRRSIGLDVRSDASRGSASQGRSPSRSTLLAQTVAGVSMIGEGDGAAGQRSVQAKPPAVRGVQINERPRLAIQRKGL